MVLNSAEPFVIGMHISALPTASTHVNPDPTRSRKLLLNAEEISKLIGKVEQRGYTLVPIDLHYTKGRVKLDDRPRQGQEAARQARDGEGARLAARAAAAHAPQGLKTKSPLARAFRAAGVADGIRTHDDWNHNPGLYR